MSKNLFSQIQDQKELSDGVIAALLPIIQEIYYVGCALDEIIYGDLGSFARGTNNDVAPDLDVGFFGVPIGNHKDWTSIGTKALTGKKEGIHRIRYVSERVASPISYCTGQP